MPVRRKNALRSLSGNDLKIFNDLKAMITNIAPSSVHFLFDQRSDELGDIPTDCDPKSIVVLFNFTDFLQVTYNIISNSPFYDQEKQTSFNVAIGDFKHINKKLVHRNSSGKVYLKKFKEIYLEIRSLIQEYDISIFKDIFSSARSDAMNILNRNYVFDKDEEKSNPKMEELYEKINISRKSMGIRLSIMMHGMSLQSVVSLNDSIVSQCKLIKEYSTVAHLSRDTEVKINECFNHMSDMLAYLKEQVILGIFTCAVDAILEIPANDKFQGYELMANPNSDIIDNFNFTCEPITPFLETFVAIQGSFRTETNREIIIQTIDEFTNYALKYPDYFLSGPIFELFVDIRILQLYSARVQVIYGTNQTTEAIYKLNSALQTSFKFFFSLRSNEINIDGVNVLSDSIKDIIRLLNDERKRVGDYYIMGFLRIDEFRVHLQKIVNNLKRINYTLCVVFQFNDIQARLKQKENVLPFSLSFFKPPTLLLFSESPPLKCFDYISMNPVIQSLIDSLNEYGIDITYNEGDSNSINIPNINHIYSSLVEAGIEIDPMSEDETFQLVYKKAIQTLKSDFVSINDTEDHKTYQNLKILHQLQIAFMALNYIGMLDYSTAIRFTYARACVNTFFKYDLLEGITFSSDFQSDQIQKLSQEYQQFTVQIDPIQIISVIIQVREMISKILFSLGAIKGYGVQLVKNLLCFLVSQPTIDLIQKIIQLSEENNIDIDEIRKNLVDLTERITKAKNPGKIQKFITQFLNYMESSENKSDSECNVCESFIATWEKSAQECINAGALYCDLSLLKEKQPDFTGFYNSISLSLDIFLNKIMIELNQICREESNEEIIAKFERLIHGSFEITEISSLLVLTSEYSGDCSKLWEILKQLLYLFQFLSIHDSVYCESGQSCQAIRNLNYQNFTSSFALESLYLATALPIQSEYLNSIKQNSNDMKRLSKKINVIGPTPYYIYENIEHEFTQIKLYEDHIDYTPLFQKIKNTLERVAPSLMPEMEDICSELNSLKIPHDKLVDFVDTISLIPSENDDAVSYIISSLNTILLSINKRQNYVTFILFTINSNISFIDLAPIFVLRHNNYNTEKIQFKSMEIVPQQYSIDAKNCAFDQFCIENQSNKINEIIDSIKIPESNFEIPTELLPFEIQEKYFKLLIDLKEQREEKFKKLANKVRTSSLAQRYHNLQQQVNKLAKHNEESIEKIREMYDQYIASSKKQNEEISELSRQFEIASREVSLDQKELENKNNVLEKEIEEKQKKLENLICSNKSLDLNNFEIENLLKKKKTTTEHPGAAVQKNQKKVVEAKKIINETQVKVVAKKEKPLSESKEYSAPSKIPSSIRHLFGPTVHYNSQQHEVMRRLCEQVAPKGHAKREMVVEKTIEFTGTEENHHFLRLLEEDKKRRRDSCINIVSMIQRNRKVNNCE